MVAPGYQRLVMWCLIVHTLVQLAQGMSNVDNRPLNNDIKEHAQDDLQKKDLLDKIRQVIHDLELETEKESKEDTRHVGGYNYNYNYNNYYYNGNYNSGAYSAIIEPTTSPKPAAQTSGDSTSTTKSTSTTTPTTTRETTTTPGTSNVQPSGPDSCGNPPGRMSKSDQEKAVHFHNLLRGQVGASNMLKMEWDDKLAMMAQKSADTCAFAHGNIHLCGQKNVCGQNIFAASYGPANWTDWGSVSWNTLVERAVRGWYGEKKYYTLSTNSCSGVCGHYTQVVWAKSTKVGCAFSKCKIHFKSQNQTLASVLMFCNYLIPGNLQNTRPYTAGPACTNCASVVKTRKAKCEDNFCDECSDNSTECKIAAFTCYNGGQFNYVSGVCDCPADYFGRDCKYAVSQGCLNGGTYNPSIKKCTCPKGVCFDACQYADNKKVNCAYFSNAGFCSPKSRYRNYMLKNCRCLCLGKH